MTIQDLKKMWEELILEVPTQEPKMKQAIELCHIYKGYYKRLKTALTDVNITSSDKETITSQYKNIVTKLVSLLYCSPDYETPQLHKIRLAELVYFNLDNTAIFDFEISMMKRFEGLLLENFDTAKIFINKCYTKNLIIQN